MKTNSKTKTIKQAHDLEEANSKLLSKLISIKQKSARVSVAKADDWRSREVRKSPLSYDQQGHHKLDKLNHKVESENLKFL